MSSIVRSYAAVCCALLLVSACGRRAVPLTTTTPVLLEAQTDPELLRAAIVRALDARRFTTESEQPGRIMARYQHRGQMLALAIDYSPTDYRVSYVDSAGMGYTQSPEGVPMISRHYDNHVARLRRTIDEEIERPEREAAEAMEQQRQHELAVLEQQRRQEREAVEAEQRERDRQRQAELERERLVTERERLRTERAQAEAEARRPIIVGHDAMMVSQLELAPRRARARFGTVRVRPRSRARWLEGQAEGRVDAASLGLGSCRGFYAGTPEHVVVVSRDLSYLRLETDSQQDPTLVVVSSDGAVYCDDDGGEGLNARIEGQFPAGTYRVFVGSYRQNTTAGYRLLVTEAPAASEAVAVQVAPPRVAAQPAPPADCRTLVIEHGHSPSAAVHCQGVDPRCAQAVLAAGHSPSSLVHCHGAEIGCARATLRAGHSPSALVHCR